jgi:hypothetical protein
MKSVMTWLRPITPLLMAVVAGCAPAYYSYSGCYVDCKYCTPPPLPYVHYEGCVCHSCAASKYLSIQPTNVDAPEEWTEHEGNEDNSDAGRP